MQKLGVITKVIAAAVMSLPFTLTAQAQNSRSFVATTGNDASDCSASAYCRTFARALTVTNSGGEIVVVDSGGFGPATITQAVIISAVGVDASISQTAEFLSGVFIDTPGNVTIRGLHLNGGSTGGQGIWAHQVGILRLYDVAIDSFGVGIYFPIDSKLAIYDSKITDCNDGLDVYSGAEVYVQNSRLDNANVTSYGANVAIVGSSANFDHLAFVPLGGTMVLYKDRASFNYVGINVGATDVAEAESAGSLITSNTTAYSIGTGSTLTGSSPGTNLTTPGQGTSGTLSPAIELQ
jgi:parallel beta helix pectate lyase-like protein